MEENKTRENFLEENFENEMDKQIDNVIENETENIVDTKEEQTFSETTNTTSTTSESETSEEEMDIETIRKMLGEVRRIPERIKTEGKYYEEEEEEDREEQESFDFTLISEALYSVYAQGLKWATYVIISRIAPGLEARVIRELHLPSSARKQITNAINKVLQKRFSQWAIKLSEEGTLFALLMLYSTTYITQAVILAYHLKAIQNNTNTSNSQNGSQNGNNENVQTEKPKRRRGRPPKKQKTETTENIQA
jgi:hypothetical protein